MVTDKELYVRLIQFCYQKHTTTKKRKEKKRSLVTKDIITFR